VASPLPVLVQAIITGAAVATAGTVPWALLAGANLKHKSSFRGYLQRPIERRHGAVIAILVAGVLFGLTHFTHSEVTIALLPYYVAVAAVYGGLAHLTDSTLPSMILHGGGNVFSAFDLFTRGRSEWQLSTTPQRLIWETGPDAAFVANAVGLLAVESAAAWAYVELARAARAARTPAEPA
jgi:membrane protease YdiL (CAAX protease family)